MTIEMIDKWVTSLRFNEIKNEKKSLCWFLTRLAPDHPSPPALFPYRETPDHPVAAGLQTLHTSISA